MFGIPEVAASQLNSCEFVAPSPPAASFACSCRTCPPLPSFSDAASVIPGQRLKLDVGLAIGPKETDQ